MIAFPSGAAHDPTSPAPCPRLLLVEDHPATRTVLQQVLRAAGYAVETASDAVEGEAHIQAGPPDLVLLDYTLPPESGVVVCQRVRARLGALYPPIIMLTVRGAEIQRQLALAAGADDCLPKPFHPQQLRERVDAWLRVGARLRGASRHLRSVEEQAAQARLEGAMAVIRAVRHRLNNDLTLPSLVLDYLLENADLSAELRGMVTEASAAILSAAQYIDALQQVRRVATSETPLGPALDLAQSTGAASLSA